jgi:putative lipoic acid-binding regulatory protein
MDEPSALSQLLEFPCDYQFKAFGPRDEDDSFVLAVREAVSSVVPVPGDGVRTRSSSRGTYICATIVVRLHNADQVQAIYASLRRIESLRYLL